MGYRRLFFDIETSYCIGWFWNPSYETSISYDQVITQAAIICICYKWEGSSKVNYLTWDKGDDKAMMAKFYDIINEADEVVAHNGDKFDIRWIRTRFLLAGYKGMPEIKSIDTLKISRSKFKFPSNRLDAIGKYLGFGGKYDTGGIDLWHDVIRKNSRVAMRKMVDYCKRDVELLEKVFLKLEGFSKPKTHIGAFMGGDKCDCQYCGSERTNFVKRRISAAGTVNVGMQCQECGKHFTTSLKAYENRGKKKKKKKKC